MCVCVCVCVCFCVIIQFPQEGQPRTASRCYSIFRFGSFSDRSVSYKTLKALWLCGLFSLQRETHRTAVGRSQDSGFFFGRAVEKLLQVLWPRRVALIKACSPHLQSKKTNKNHDGTITFSTFLSFFCKLKNICINILKMSTILSLRVASFLFILCFCYVLFSFSSSSFFHCSCVFFFVLFFFKALFCRFRAINRSLLLSLLWLLCIASHIPPFVFTP